jgi:hypothetical protein
MYLRPRREGEEVLECLNPACNNDQCLGNYVDLSTCTVVYTHHKNKAKWRGKVMKIPLDGTSITWRLIEEMDQWALLVLGNGEETCFFCNDVGEPFQSGGQFKSFFQRCLKLIGVEAELTPHSMRSIWVDFIKEHSELKNEEVGLAMSMGHSVRAWNRHYDRGKVNRALERLASTVITPQKRQGRPVVHSTKRLKGYSREDIDKMGTLELRDAFFEMYGKHTQSGNLVWLRKKLQEGDS